MPAYKDKKRNTWYVSYSDKDSVSNKFKTITKRGFPTKHDAQIWESLQKTKVEATTTASFRYMLKEYLKNSHAKPYLVARKTNTLEKYFSRYIDMPITKIQRKDLMQWRTRLVDYDQLSDDGRNHCIAYVKSVFLYANAVYGIENPSTIMKPYPVEKKHTSEYNVWTPDEFNQFISSIDREVYRIYFTFLYWTGCRRGEALALTKNDIKGNQVSITKSIRTAKAGFTPLKTGSSKRTITIDDYLVEELKPLIERAKPFVFGSISPLSITNVQAVFDKGIKKSGVKRIRLHDLRHSHATFLINSGANIVAVSRRLGHANINQTLTTYTHLLQKSEDELIEIIQKTTKNTII